MRERFARFMAGRYGNDQLNRFLSVAGLVLALLAVIFARSGLSTLFWLLALAAIAFTYLRLFSRNVYKRSDENAKYLRLKHRFVSYVRLKKEGWVQRKDYKFFTCPACHTTLRVPRNKGKINIVCRKCGNCFQGRT